MRVFFFQRGNNFVAYIIKLTFAAELQRRGCDIGRSTYAKYEAGELNIRASVIIKLKKNYNCSYDDYF